MEDIRDEQELGLFTPAASGATDGGQPTPMLRSVFEARRDDGSLPAGSLVLGIAGDAITLTHQGSGCAHVPRDRRCGHGSCQR